jgi:hypothetical protein
MARTELTALDMPGALDIDGEDLTWEAADNTDKNYVDLTGREILLIRNDNVGVQTVTVHSAPDAMLREGDLVFTDIAAGAYAYGGPFGIAGWSIGGQLHIDASVADVMFCVLRMPSSWAGR